MLLENFFQKIQKKSEIVKRENILPFATENDIIRCIEIVRKELSNKNIIVEDGVLKEITEDIMNISYAKGGGYSDNIIQSFAKPYIEYGFYKKFLTNKS